MKRRSPLRPETRRAAWTSRLGHWPMLAGALVVGLGLGALLVGPPGAPPRQAPLPVAQTPLAGLQSPMPPAIQPSPGSPSPAGTESSAPAAEPSTRSAALPPAPVMPAPARDELPAWRRHAVAVPDVAGKAMIAVVIDDMGIDQRRSAAMVKLPGPLTLAFLPYGRDLRRQTAAAHDLGHELMVHVSMQPLDAAIKPGPNALTTDLPEDDIRRRLAWALDAFDGYVGINNHMGSRFTADGAGMTVVMEELKTRGLLFLDSRTGQHSVGTSLAAAHDVPHAGRQVFLDNDLSFDEVNRQLAETERLARQAGLAVAIGHPHDVTIAALAAWLPTLKEKGFALVPVSAIVARLEARDGASLRGAASNGDSGAADERPAP